MRRNNLSYLRERSGKSARLAGKDFDRAAVNDVAVLEEEAEDVAEEMTEGVAEAPETETSAVEAPKAEVETAVEAKEEAKESK